jgi:hypothetical protein
MYSSALDGARMRGFYWDSGEVGQRRARLLQMIRPRRFTTDKGRQGPLADQNAKG